MKLSRPLFIDEIEGREQKRLCRRGGARRWPTVSGLVAASPGQRVGAGSSRSVTKGSVVALQIARGQRSRKRTSMLRAALGLGAALTLALLGSPGEAQAQACITSGTNQACTNSVAISGGNIGIADTATLALTNRSTGSVSGTGGFDEIGYGILAGTANVSNWGSISGTGGAGGFFGDGYGISANGTATVSNWGSISGTGGAGGSFDGNDGRGISAGTATVTNWGSVSGTGGAGGPLEGGDGRGISASAATASNWGGITGTGGVGGTNGGSGRGIDTGPSAYVGNWGTITGTGGAGASGSGGWGIGISATTANVSNWGSISGTGGAGGTFGGNGYGILATTANVFNCGTITGTGGAGGGLGYGIFTYGTAHVTNCGTISGSTAALNLTNKADTLTLLPGSKIIGAINLGGGGDTVNFRVGNQNLTFDTLAGATITSNVPFAVSGNRVATIDPTPFAMTDRNLMDVTRAVSSLLGDRLGDMGIGAAGPALTFAGESGANARIADAFANFPGSSAYAPDAAVFKNPTVQYSDGTSVWGRGFAVERVQQADDTLLRTVNQFYGGMVGGDWQAQANLRLGAFIGAGRTRSSEDLTMGGNEGDLVFGGLFGRYAWGASFLGLAVQGGHSSTDTSRNINNNLALGGLETAKASYNGWYVSPEASYGLHYGLGRLAGASYTLTPSVKLRYLYASFDGYTESGTSAPVTVGTRAVQGFEERGQLKLTRTQMFAPTEAIMTNIYGGVLGLQRAGRTTVDAMLLGQEVPFATLGKNDVWAGFGGAGLDIRTGQVALFGSAEYLILSDSSSVISGRGGIRLLF